MKSVNKLHEQVDWQDEKQDRVLKERIQDKINAIKNMVSIKHEAKRAKATKNTSDIIVEALESAGVSHVFGIPGGAIEDLNTSLYKSQQIVPIVTKHEQGAAFMADGYARVSGRLGVCCSTAGPGASNLITGLASSYADSIPVCSLTGQVATSVFGKGAIQESGNEGMNMVDIFSNFTKYSGMIISEDRAQYMMQKGIRLAQTGRKGPVHINLPADIMKRPAVKNREFTKLCDMRLFDRERVTEAAKALLAAKRPVIIVGWGAILSRAADELLQLAQLLDIPVATSPKAKGVFPESHILSLGVLGFAGSPASKEYIIEEEVDVMLAVGTSFNEMMTGGWDERLAPSKHLIQIDIDTKEIGKNYNTTIGLVGDARAILNELCYAANRELGADIDQKCLRSAVSRPDLAFLKGKHAAIDDNLDTSGGKYYHPKELIRDIQGSFPKNSIFFADIGTSMAWAIRYLKIDRPYSFYVALGFGSMGYAVAAPIGAKIAFQDRPIIALVGDGSFLMNGTEVATAVNYNVPVIWIIFNNAMLGMVYHGRKLFKQPIPEGISSEYKRVDFVKIAEGLGARGIRIDTPGQINQDLVMDIMAEGRPTVLDVWIDDQAVPPIHSRIETVNKHFG
ncbi:MAG: thiamine pyrophosphate-binding protein [Proteobacteria bacterium]|nr:thiamine pyrophosphate-binding protein [Pseudomonadota bacterium]MBU1708802.1 thiamine pyrophosphate-binding protein [Pseudomonadota bacterium]